MLKLKLQFFGYLMQIADSLEKSCCWEGLRAEGEENIKGWDGWMASPMQWTQTWANFGRWWGTERTGMLQSMGSQRIRHNWATKQHHNIVIILYLKKWTQKRIHIQSNAHNWESNLMGFDKYINRCNSHHNQDIENFYYLKNSAVSICH